MDGEFSIQGYLVLMDKKREYIIIISSSCDIKSCNIVVFSHNWPIYYGL